MFTTEFQYVVIRYLLNELADEAANVGIVAVADDPPRMITKFIEDPTVKSRNDVRIRKEVVDRFASLVAEQKRKYDASAQDAPSAATILGQIREFASGIVRSNMARSVLTNNMEADFQLLYDQWVRSSPEAAARRVTGPRDPLGVIRRKASSALVKKFREGYGTLTRRLIHRRYEVKGTVHRNLIDLAMVGRERGARREYLFQHVLLFPDAEETFTQAAGLCWRWDDMRETNNAVRNLTAVLYERSGQQVRGVNDATELLKKSNVEVARLHELPRVARDLKGELNLAA